jgi:hypothetical protein
MRDVKGLGGYGIKGLRKNLLTPSPQRSGKETGNPVIVLGGMRACLA